MKRLIAILLAVICVVSLAACDFSGAIVYDIGNTDRANYFEKTYNSFVEQYGEAQMVSNETYGNVLSGVAVVRLLDFTGDGTYELYIAYADGTVPYVNKQIVYGFDFGPATILDEEITSKASDSSETPAIWIYKDSTDRSYIVKGEDLSKEANYSTYIQMRDGEKVYAFDTEFTEKDGKAPAGTYEKIKVAGITAEDYDLIAEENEKVIDSIKGQSDN